MLLEAAESEMKNNAYFETYDYFVCSIAECFYVKNKNAKSESNACDMMKINVTYQTDSNFSWSVLFFITSTLKSLAIRAI